MKNRTIQLKGNKYRNGAISIPFIVKEVTYENNRVYPPFEMSQNLDWKTTHICNAPI